MNAKLCDACKKILAENEVQRASGEMRYYELCKKCKEKFDVIKSNYNKNEEKLNKQYDELRNKYKEDLKGIGIDYE